MAKVKKQPRPRAETPKGFRDYFGTEVAQRKAMLDQITTVYQLYGFDALESSAVETVEALGKFLPDVDRPNEGVFAWQEDEADWLALRYDLTAPLARVYAQHRNELPTPYRRFAMGPVWRNEKPGPGRFRQFYQCDADTVGSGSVAADAEICAMLSDVLEAVGIPRGDYLIRVNNRKVLNGVLEVMGIADDPRRDDVLRTIDKFDKVGEAGVRQLLTTGRTDASGAEIDGVGLTEDQAGPLLTFINARSKAEKDTINNDGFPIPTSEQNPDDFDGPDAEFERATYWLRHEAEKLEALDHDFRVNLKSLVRLYDLVKGSEEGVEGVVELVKIATLLAAQGYGPDRIVIDPSVVRGLGYYTGPVYEAELTFEITDEKGRPRQFGSVAGGGRYDDLVKRFTGQAVPATGVSIGVDRLLAALHAKGRMDKATVGPVVVTVMDRDRMADYQAMVGELRAAGIRAEVYLGNPKNFGNQLKYADKRNTPVAVIAGSDEFDKGVLQIKDLVLGAKIAETATHEEWKEQPAQFEIKRADLVAEIRKILDA